MVWLVVAGGLVTLARQTFPTRAEATAGMAVPWLDRFLPATGLSVAGSVLPIFVFFAKAGLFVFGSGLAIIPFLYGGVVQGHHWLTDRQFVDAVAIAMITPGPVVITVSFIGYVVAGVAGATAAALGVFLPVYAVVVLLVPSYTCSGIARRRKLLVPTFLAMFMQAESGEHFRNIDRFGLCLSSCKDGAKGRKSR